MFIPYSGNRGRILFTEPGSPWENGNNESFNGKLRDELLDREIFYTLREAQVLIEGWRQHSNGVRPHSALGYRPPAPEARAPLPLARCLRLALELARSPNVGGTNQWRQAPEVPEIGGLDYHYEGMAA